MELDRDELYSISQILGSLKNDGYGYTLRGNILIGRADGSTIGIIECGNGVIFKTMEG